MGFPSVAHTNLSLGVKYESNFCPTRIIIFSMCTSQSSRVGRTSNVESFIETCDTKARLDNKIEVERQK